MYERSGKRLLHVTGSMGRKSSGRTFPINTTLFLSLMPSNLSRPLYSLVIGNHMLKSAFKGYQTTHLTFQASIRQCVHVIIT